jgi:hypothetical protein
MVKSQILPRKPMRSGPPPRSSPEAPFTFLEERCRWHPKQRSGWDLSWPVADSVANHGSDTGPRQMKWGSRRKAQSTLVNGRLIRKRREATGRNPFVWSVSGTEGLRLHALRTGDLDTSLVTTTTTARVRTLLRRTRGEAPGCWHAAVASQLLMSRAERGLGRLPPMLTHARTNIRE